MFKGSAWCSTSWQTVNLLGKNHNLFIIICNRYSARTTAVLHPCKLKDHDSEICYLVGKIWLSWQFLITLMMKVFHRSFVMLWQNIKLFHNHGKMTTFYKYNDNSETKVTGQQLVWQWYCMQFRILLAHQQWVRFYCLLYKLCRGKMLSMAGLPDPLPNYDFKQSTSVVIIQLHYKKLR